LKQQRLEEWYRRKYGVPLAKRREEIPIDRQEAIRAWEDGWAARAGESAEKRINHREAV
jgi:hypothetical protein